MMHNNGKLFFMPQSGFAVYMAILKSNPSLAIGTYYAIKGLNPTKREAGKATDFVTSKTSAILKFNADRKCEKFDKQFRLKLE